ncbi:uncharacterized protein LOC136026076 isoform X2 [Artemia franciscana]
MIWVAHNYWNGVVHKIDKVSTPRTCPQDSSSSKPEFCEISRDPPDGNSNYSDCEDCADNLIEEIVDIDEASICCSCCESEFESESCSCSAEDCSSRKSMKSDTSLYDGCGGIRGRSISPLIITRQERRPPVYSVEDYAAFLQKLCKLPPAQFYAVVIEKNKKNNENKEIWKNNENLEMISRQPASVSELLYKLKLDLKSAYSSFAKEFVSYPCDGVTVLLDILRLIQLSQAEISGPPKAAIRRENHARFRRAVADEQSCLACLQHCLTLDPEEAPRRLVDHDNGLYTLAVCLLSHVNRSRIAALELLSRASEVQPNGHYRVSDALSALRLRFGEPIRLKFLVGMMMSGKGELLLAGIKFFNALILSAPTVRDKVYLQKEIEDAGFNADMLEKCDDDETEILLRKEVALWRDAVIDVDAMAERLGLVLGTNSALKKDFEDLRSRLARLEDEKSIFSTLESSLRKRISELESENSHLRSHLEDSLPPTYDLPSGSIVIKVTNNQVANHDSPSVSLSSLSDGFEKLDQNSTNITESIRGEDEIYIENKYNKIDSDHIYETTHSSLIIPTNIHSRLDDDTTIDEVLQELSDIVIDESENSSETKDENRFEDRASPDRESDELKIVPTRFPKPPKRNQEFNHVDLNITYDESETDGFQALENHMPRFKSSFGRKISQNYGSNFDRSESDSDNGKDFGKPVKKVYSSFLKQIPDFYLQKDDSSRYSNFTEYSGLHDKPAKGHRRRTQIINYELEQKGRREESRRRSRSFESLLVQAIPISSEMKNNDHVKSNYQLKRFEGSKYHCARARLGFLKCNAQPKGLNKDHVHSQSEFCTEGFFKTKNPRLFETTSGLY